jgi:uncharacterized cupin superfamily protein
MAPVIPEAPLERDDTGLAPRGEGWFVVNARDARWLEGDFGAYTRFEGDARFPQLGVNIAVLAPGQPACLYHGEGDQEGFLVLSGECVLLIEGEERRLQAWDFVHSPPWTEHVLVGAGDGPCAVLGLGSRTSREVVYPKSELAERYRASARQTTRKPEEAYADTTPDQPIAYREGWLPG